VTGKRLAFLVTLGTALIAALVWVLSISSDAPQQNHPKAELGLMTSLPIYWGESAELDGMLANDQPMHWVRTQLETEFELVPLDALAGPDSTEPSQALDNLPFLLLAQPRALPPADMVALDSWVRGGGWALIFADPMLTEHTEFGFGDQRRPQDIATLSPILSRWGLQQFIDEDQGDAVRMVIFRDVAIPLRKAGRFEILQDGEAECELLAQDVIARCKIGKGYAMIVADAAVLEREGNLEVAQTALNSLVLASLNRPKNNSAD
jgi:hypothetical protein